MVNDAKGYLENIARLLLEDLGLTGFSTNAASYMGICRSNTDEVQLAVDDRALAMETLLKLNKKYNGRIATAAGPLGRVQTAATVLPWPTRLWVSKTIPARMPV